MSVLFSAISSVECFFMEEKDKSLWRMLGVLSTVGITLVAATVIGFFIGLKLDELLGTSPWLQIIFLLFGIAAGFINLFRTALRMERKIEDLESKKKK